MAGAAYWEQWESCEARNRHEAGDRHGATPSRFHVESVPQRRGIPLE
jgi:hypothetical protein